MSHYLSLYRKYRPEVFSELIGQEHIVRILKHQIASDTLSHAYLLCGTRGTGKTTTARILAKAVNCESSGERPCGVCENCKAISAGGFMDVIEIDAASNNGVDNIRELRESVNYPPSVGEKKVYIIDEVHMLSQGGYNALLKTLEEPPEHVMFILATTNPEKMPQTVMSRCMRLDFKRVPSRKLTAKMRGICEGAGVEATDGALSLLAANADGSVRDALSLLEQCLSGGDEKIDRETVLEYLGAVSQDFYMRLTDNILNRRVSDAFFLLDTALRDGKDVKCIMKDWMEYYRSLLIVKFVKDPSAMLNMSTENIEKLKEQSREIPVSTLNRSIMILAKAINDATYSTQARILMEVAIVAIAEETEYGDAMPEGTGHGQRQRHIPSINSAENSIPVSAQKPTRKPAVENPPEPPAENPLKPDAGSLLEPRGKETPENEPEASMKETPENEPDAGSLPEPRGKETPENEPEAGMKEASENKREHTRAELDYIWEAVSEKIIREQASMRVMKNFSLAAMNDVQFKVVAAGVNEAFEKRMRDKTEDICDAMEELVGRKMKMVIKSGEDDPKPEERVEDDIRSIAEKASREIGIPVGIKDSAEEIL